MKGYVNIGKAAGHFITIAVCEFVFNGDRRGIEIARGMCDKQGNHPPIDEMIRFVLCESGHLLTAGNSNARPHAEERSDDSVQADVRQGG